MYITFTDKNFNNISNPIDTFYSVIWSNKWSEAGSCQLILPIKHFAAANAAVFVYNSDRNNFMIIEDIETDGKSAIVSGVSLETMLEWRVLTGPTYYSNQTIESAVRGLLQLFATGSAFPEYAFINTPLLFAASKGLTPKADMYYKVGMNLADMVRQVYTPQGWSYRLVRSGSNVVFDTLVSLDRTSGQSINNRAVFASSKGDISSYSYNKNSKDYKNYAFLRTVWGYDSATQTANGVATRYFNAAVAGEERRIVYFDGTENYTTAQMDILCADKLKKYPQIVSLTLDVSPACSLVYGVDYNLGDVCDIVISEIGLTATARCTAVDFVYEKGSRRIIPQFGEYKISSRNYIKREAGK